ncbi:MAG TPA: helix-turn-helix transcriptional regulator [Clostridia bacterium]|nr:helix-turn-helix transcriptional regulator [Clostridia bacterium]
MELAKNLKALRIEYNLSQQKLANAIGVSQKAIDYWEKGINEPKASYILLLAEYFDVSCDFLLGKDK